MLRDETCLRRQWALLRSLSASRRGLTLREMAAELCVTSRTIRRDLDVFRSVGFPLVEEVGDFGRKTWRIGPTDGRPPLSFTFDEAVALYLGRRLLEPLAGTFFHAASSKAFQKIHAALGREVLDYLKGFAGFFHQTGVGLVDYETKAELIDDLMVAVEDRKAIRLLYRSEAEATAGRRDVHPYGVVYHRGALYLVALDATREIVKHYKVDRIDEVEILATRFDRPEGFDLGSHMSEAFGVYRDGEPVNVRVRFSPSVSRYVREARRHDSQRLSPLPDGGLVAEFTVSGTEEIKSWILGFGAKAVVLEPDALRRDVIEELRHMITGYVESADSACDSSALTSSTREA